MESLTNREVRLLDVTLREAPILYWGVDYIEKTVSLLEMADVDIIEVAFLGKTSEFDYFEGSTHVNTIEQANGLLKEKKEGILYTVCLNGSSYTIKDINECNPRGIDAIRYVLMENRFDDEINDLWMIKNKGYKLMVQHRNIIAYSDSQIMHIVEVINQIEPFAYSIVDTNGAMYPDDVRRICNLICDKLDEKIYFGFHGHDNHKLATSNSELFLEITKNRNRIFIDGSVMGVGIGAGNAHTELLALYMNKYEGKKYKMNYLYELMDVVISNLKKKCSCGYDGVSLVTGEFNTLVSHGQYLLNHLRQPKLNTINSMISEMPTQARYNNNFEYWRRYNSVFVQKRKNLFLEYLRKVIRLRFFRPVRNIYLKLRYGW